MIAGAALTLWTVRVSCALYVLALAVWLTRGHAAARLPWTLAFLFYLTHVAAAFSFYHGWSHAAAYRDTARQTAEMFGMDWGGGLYFNYFFTGVWTLDVVWMWRNAASYQARPRWISTTIHAFLAFMFLNGAVVFASGWTRWLGVAATAALCVLWLAQRSIGTRRDRRIDV